MRTLSTLISATGLIAVLLLAPTADADAGVSVYFYGGAPPRHLHKHGGPRHFMHRGFQGRHWHHGVRRYFPYRGPYLKPRHGPPRHLRHGVPDHLRHDLPHHRRHGVPSHLRHGPGGAHRHNRFGDGFGTRGRPGRHRH